MQIADMKMPVQIKRFEQLFLGSLALGVINAALQYDILVAQSSASFVLIVQTFTFLISIALVLLTSRKRSRLTKWLLVILFALGTVASIPALSSVLKSGLPGIITVAQFIMQSVAIYLLFTENSIAWFKAK